MSISAISSSSITAALAQPKSSLAPDGDTKSKEATESASLQTAEKANGGQAPKPASAATLATPSGVNKLV